MRQAWCAIALFILAPHGLTAATKLMVTATHDDQNVADAEVCFYEARVADPLYALERSTLRCLPAEKVLELPPKVFRVYARAGDKLITPDHAFITGDTSGELKRLAAELEPGGHIALSRSLLANERLVLLIGDAAQNHGMVAPLLVERQRALVPADVALIAVLLHDGRPVWTSERVQAGPGGEYRLTVASTPASPASVIVSFHGTDPFPENATASSRDSRYSSKFLRLLHDQEAPTVELVDARGTVHRPEVTVLRPSNIFDIPYVFRAVAAGTATVRVRGRRFVTTETKVEVGPTGVVVAREAGRIVPGAEVTVIVPAAMAGVKPTPKTCGAPDSSEESRGRQLTFWTCAAGLGGVSLSPAVLSRCEEKHRQRLSEDGSVVEFSDVPAGDFIVTLQREEMFTKILRGTATVGETATLNVDADEVFVAGTVTRDGRPAHAHVRFEHGEAATDPHTGAYTVLLAHAPGSHPVHVVACDDSWAYIHLPKSEIPALPGYDIEVPANALEVRVRDAVTNQPVADAKVDAFGRPSAESRAGSGILVTARDDRYVVESLEKGTVLSVCASKAGYKHACTELTITARAQEVSLSLSPVAGKGRVTAPGYSQITWARPDGSLIEQASIDAEGRFAFSTAWNEGHAVLVGTAPLFVTSQKTLDEKGELVIAPPVAGATKAVRFTISPSYPQEKVVLGLWVNGLRVPTSVLGTHQRKRRQPWFVTKTQDLTIADLFAGDVVSVVAGPDVDFFPREGGIDNPMIFAGRAPVEVKGVHLLIE